VRASGLVGVGVLGGCSRVQGEVTQGPDLRRRDERVGGRGRPGAAGCSAAGVLGESLHDFVPVRLDRFAEAVEDTVE
jgi:hypothetical protein